MNQTDATGTRLGAAIVAIAPAVLLAGFVYHPYLNPPTDTGTIAAAAIADTTRWGLAHLMIAVGYGLMVLAFMAIQRYLREMGGKRWSDRALPFIVMGSTLFAVLTGMEFAVLAAAETGGNASEAQAALFPWFVPVLLTGGGSFALGAFGFTASIVGSGIAGPSATRLIVGALVVMAIARLVPLSAAPYVLGVAGVLALWPLAYAMWRHRAGPPEPQRPTFPT